MCMNGRWFHEATVIGRLSFLNSSSGCGARALSQNKWFDIRDGYVCMCVYIKKYTKHILHTLHVYIQINIRTCIYIHLYTLNTYIIYLYIYI